MKRIIAIAVIAVFALGIAAGASAAAPMGTPRSLSWELTAIHMVRPTAERTLYLTAGRYTLTVAGVRQPGIVSWGAGGYVRQAGANVLAAAVDSRAGTVGISGRATSTAFLRSGTYTFGAAQVGAYCCATLVRSATQPMR